METPNFDFIIPKWCKEACYERATATLFYANKKNTDTIQSHKTIISNNE